MQPKVGTVHGFALVYYYIIIFLVLSVTRPNNNNNNNTLFNHATFRSEKRSLKHVRAKTMYTINTIQYIKFIKTRTWPNVVTG